MVKSDNIITSENKRVNKVSVDKSRYFCFLIYPESAPDDVMIKLESMNQPMAVSPLHNQDIDKTATEEYGHVVYKKAHWHVIYIASNNVTEQAVKKRLIRKLGNGVVSIVKICDSVSNYYKYLTHESSDAIAKNKHKYAKNDIVHLNNFDISRYTDASLEAKEDAMNELCKLIINYGIENVVQLDNFIQRNPECGFTKERANRIIKQYTSLIRLYFDGVHQEKKKFTDVENAN